MTQKVFLKLQSHDKIENSALLTKIRDEVFAELEADGKADQKESTFFAIASTAALDRDDEVLVPRGVQVEEFSKNPVMLQIHNYHEVSVGKVLKLGVSDEEVGFSFQFPDTDVGNEMRYLYENDFMSAFSVGFIPRSFVRIDDNTPDKVEIDLSKVGERTGVVEIIKGEKDKFILDLTKYDRRPRAVVASWELLEISPVPVPSNPEALLVRAVRKAMSQYDDDPVKASMAAAQLKDGLAAMSTSLTDFMKGLKDFEVRGPVPKHTTPIDNEATFDASQSRAGLARWASADGSGSKDTMDWGKFSQGYGWFDGNTIDAFTSYKLPHHAVQDGDLVAVWRGVTGAMANLLAGRAEIGGDEQAVYNHLARHYTDNDVEPPAFTREYTEQQLKDIGDGTYQAEATAAVAQHSTPILVSESGSWDAEAALTNVRTWACADSEELDEAKYTTAFAWADGDSYKLLHHDVVDGDLVATWAGVTFAMGELLSESGGDIPTDARRAVYDHLAKHYNDHERKAPEFKEYNEFEVRGIQEDWMRWIEVEGTDEVGNETLNIKRVVSTGDANGHMHTVDNEQDGRTSVVNGHSHPYVSGAARTGEEDGHSHPVPTANAAGDSDLKAVEDQVKRLGNQLAELEANLEVRLGVVTDMIEEMVTDIAKRLGAPDGDGGAGGAGSGVGDDGSDEDDEGQKMKEALDQGAERLAELLQASH